MRSKKTMTIKVALCVAIAFSFLAVQSANALVIELALVLDGSGSISPSDWTLQVSAYESIFGTDFMDSYVTPGDELYISVYQFNTTVTKEIDMQQITNDAEAAALGVTIGNLTQGGGQTNTAGAVNVAALELTGNGIISDKMIIDISTDGVPYLPPDDAEADALAAAAAANLDGVIVNALGVGTGVSEDFLEDFTNAGGGFYLTADSFTEFEAALSEKLYREIPSIPDASTVFLLGSACLVGLAGIRRRFG